MGNINSETTDEAAIPAVCSPPLDANCGGGSGQDHKLRAWARQRGGRLLVVDDSPLERAVTASVLEKAGFKVVLAADGREALTLIQDSPLPFDMVVMDVSMPEIDGLTAARRIRAMPAPRRHVPIVALTANTGPNDRDACLAAGMNDYTAKPLSLSLLLGAIQAHLPPLSR